MNEKNERALGAISALGQTADLFGTWYNIAKPSDMTNFELQRQLYDNSNNIYNSNDTLLAAINANQPLNTDLSLTDVGDYTTGQEVGNFASSALKGASVGATVGSIIPGLGTLAGGVIGSVAGIIGGGISSGIHHRNSVLAQKEQNKLNLLANNRNLWHFQNQAQNLENDYTRGLVSNGLVSAYGGWLPQFTEDFDNGITFIREGGSHESNPLGGVPMGIAPDGEPNLVEEGEVIWSDYVFSNRINIPKKIKEDYKLPNDVKTFADATEYIQKESEERPNDPISKEYLNKTMSELATIQEYIKAEKDANVFAKGGKIHIAKNKRGTFTAAAKKRGMSVQEFASKVLANKSKYSSAMVKKANFARNASKWKHALGGHLFGDGDGLNYIGIEPEFDPTNYVYNDGSYYTKYADPDYVFKRRNYRDFEMPLWPLPLRYEEPDLTELTKQELPTRMKELTTSVPMVRPNYVNGELDLRLIAPNSIIGPSRFKTVVTPPDNNRSGINPLRLAPVLGDSIQALTDLFGATNRENYTNPDIIGRATRNIRDVRYNPSYEYMTYTPDDINAEEAMDRANDLAVLQYLTNLSGGNRSALAANISNANFANQIGAGTMRAQRRLANREQLTKVRQLNLAQRQANAEGALKADMSNQSADYQRLAGREAEAKLREAIYNGTMNARNANRVAALESIGTLGKEIETRNLINRYPNLLFDVMMNYKNKQVNNLQ